jgi:hypothetical protein
LQLKTLYSTCPALHTVQYNLLSSLTVQLNNWRCCNGVPMSHILHIPSPPFLSIPVLHTCCTCTLPLIYVNVHFISGTYSGSPNLPICITLQLRLRQNGEASCGAGPKKLVQLTFVKIDLLYIRSHSSNKSESSLSNLCCSGININISTMEEMESVRYITYIANQRMSGAALFFISNINVGKRGNTSSVVGHCIL